MVKKVFSTTDLIEQIRDYQNKNSELLESHHFVFDCPLECEGLGGNTKLKPEFIWMGINPGNDEESWEKTNENTEETRDRNFQLDKRTDHSNKMMKKLKKCLGNVNFTKTTLTEMFFWGSDDIKGGFKNRYGYPFHNNRHMKFCLEINKELFKRINPKFIIGPHYAKITKNRINIIKNYFNLELIKEYRNKINNNVFIERYIMDGKHQYLNCKFPGRGNWEPGEWDEMCKKIQEIINE